MDTNQLVLMKKKICIIVFIAEILFFIAGAGYRQLHKETGKGAPAAMQQELSQTVSAKSL
ncbi:hypothetical protein [Chitinophaga solisilvae]|uniref:Uncharacterized protein n=1 Tax=Chitinophaga solisilvae TaxID=1233460 RepID=A0A3S1JCT7_9BACT|nr:hypothetical protein [Chitinophaga solisilvae]NSL85492.1 hypothetical protein [Chitinophaga solisilvae]